MPTYRRNQKQKINKGNIEIKRTLKISLVERLAIEEILRIADENESLVEKKRTNSSITCS